MYRPIAAIIVLAIALPIGNQASGDAITLYTELGDFQDAVGALGLSSEVIDFETLPDGTPVPPGDVYRPSPEVFSIFGGTNTATFSTASSFVYEDFVYMSPTHSLREDDSEAIALSFGSPIVAVGVFALDIDNPVSDAASALYRSTTLPDVLQLFDNTGGGEDVVAFLGAIATDDTLTVPRAILTEVVYDQSNYSTPEFTYLDDVRLGVPEPDALCLLTVGALALVRCRTASSNRS